MADRCLRFCVVCSVGWLRLHLHCLSFCESDNSVFHGLFVRVIIVFSTHGMCVMVDRWHWCCVKCGGVWLRW